MNEDKQSDAQVVRDLAASLGEMSYPLLSDGGESPHVILPDGYVVHDLEKRLINPIRKRSKVVVTDAESFIAYVNKHAIPDKSVIYADVDSEASRLGLVCVLNDDGENVAGWRDHTVTFAPKLSVEWTRWIGKNKVPMTQADFATWLEENMRDVADVDKFPSGSMMLQLALEFERTAEKALKSKVNLQSGGMRLTYVDDDSKDTTTSMEVFSRFMLGLLVFDGAAARYRVEARLKYREQGGKVSFWYELIRPDLVFKAAVESDLEQIKEKTGLLLLNGKP